MKNWICLFSIGLLTSCASTSYFTIDTFSPSSITFPSSVKKLLIVNNATPQPGDTGYEYKLMGVVQDTAKANADSTAYDFCKYLGQAIAESPYFEDVLLYDGVYRKDKHYLSDEPLSEEEVNELCENNEADGIVSLDRLLFQTKKTIRGTEAGYFEGIVDIHTSGTMRVYLPGRKKPLGTVLLLDSLKWGEAAFSKEELSTILPPIEDYLRTAGGYEGSKMYSNFVPYWNQETRWLYNGNGSRWKEAIAFARVKKWTQAQTIWTSLFEQSSNEGYKAKAAANLAVCYELNGNLEEAYDWAEKAFGLFESIGVGEDDKAMLYQKAYKERMKNRIQEDRKLNLQLKN